MNNFLVIDFGASLIKTAIVNEDKLENVKNYPCPKITAENVSEIFKNIYSSLTNTVDCIFICTQMHGFFALDENNKPLTEYINWQDARAGEKIDGASTFSLIDQKFGTSFRKKTGMKLKLGLPILNLIHMARMGELKGDIKAVSIPEFLVLKNCDNQTNLSHETLVAGMGYWNIYEDKSYTEILNFYKEIAGGDIIFNKSVKEIKPAGYINKVPVYVGVGDHQCALLGAGLEEKNQLSINLGTGSQVSLIDEPKTSGMFEQRPFFNGKMLSTITHIPSGRVLNQFVKDEKDWATIHQLTIADLQNAEGNIDLAIFEGAYNYKGAKVENVNSSKEYFANLLKSYINQYIGIIEKLETMPSEIILSGGIARKLKIIKEYIEQKTNLKIKIVLEGEETFLGLRKLGREAKK